MAIKITETQLAELKDLVSSLPHIESILSLAGEAGIERWIRRAASRENSLIRVKWLIDRLSGIGGSEIGILVSDKYGEVDLFNDAPLDLVRDKMMLETGIPDNGAMRFGREVEPIVEKMFIEDTTAAGCKVTRRDDLILALSKARHPSHPWMRYSPDSVIEIDGKIWLPDYKIPATRYGHDEIPMRYRAQLHQGYILLSEMGVNVEGILLVQCPLQDRSIHVTDLTIDEQLIADIKETGDQAWYDNVLAGVLPDAVARVERDLSEDSVEELKLLLRKYAILNKVESQSKAKLSEVKDAIALMYRATGASVSVKLPDASVTSKPSFDLELAARFLSKSDAINPALMKPKLDSAKMLEQLIAAKVDPDLYTKPELELNEHEIMLALASCGKDVKEFIFAKSSTRIGRESNLALVASLASDRVDEFVKELIGQNDAIPSPTC